MQKRRCRLPKRRLQLKLIVVFLGFMAAGLAIQCCLSMVGVYDVVRTTNGLSAYTTDALIESLFLHSLITAVVVLPLAFIVGVFVTFRIAGPAHRIEQHLRAIAAGADPGECRVRRDDELQEVAAALNAAVARLRTREAVLDDHLLEPAETVVAD